jgi:hypothetical protein
MAIDPPLRVKDRVELLPGAPVPPQARVRPGTRGRIVIPSDPDLGAEVTVQFGQGQRVLRIHPRWLRRV